MQKHTFTIVQSPKKLTLLHVQKHFKTLTAPFFFVFVLFLIKLATISKLKKHIGPTEGLIIMLFVNGFYCYKSTLKNKVL